MREVAIVGEFAKLSHQRFPTAACHRLGRVHGGRRELDRIRWVRIALKSRREHKEDLDGWDDSEPATMNEQAVAKTLALVIGAG